MVCLQQPFPARPGIFLEKCGNYHYNDTMKRTANMLFLTAHMLSLFITACAGGAHYEKSSAPAGASDEMYQAQRSGHDNDSRMIAYSVSLELLVKNIEKTRETLIEQVTTNNGFIVRESDNYINARIPAGNMDNFINTTRTLGKIEYESKTGTDITDQYRDNIVRLSNLKSVREKYLALLEKADTVTDILGIEKELERVNTEIEIMEGRIKYAEQSVAYSNITVRYRERAKPGPIGWIFYGLYMGIKWLFVW
jgi:hypothetical protein